MKQSELKKLIREEIKKALRMEANGEEVIELNMKLFRLFNGDMEDLQDECDNEYGLVKYTQDKDYEWAIGRGDDFPNALIIKVKTIEYDEYGLPLINGRPLLTMRIEKLINNNNTTQTNTNMKREELQKLIREEIKKALKMEANGEEVIEIRRKAYNKYAKWRIDTIPKIYNN